MYSRFLLTFPWKINKADKTTIALLSEIALKSGPYPVPFREFCIFNWLEHVNARNDFGR